MSLDSHLPSPENQPQKPQSKLAKLGAAAVLAVAGASSCGNSVTVESRDCGVDESAACPASPPQNPFDIIREETAKLLVSDVGMMIDLGGPQYKDVPVYNPDYQYVMTASNNDIMPGSTNADGSLTGCWLPMDPVTREWYAKFIVDAYGFNITTQGGQHFPDVSPDRWSYPYVETLYHWSVINGDPDGTFKPEKNVQYNEANTEAVKAMNPVPQ